MDLLQGISQIMKEARASGSAEAFEQLEAALGRRRDLLRETLQEQTAAAIREIIDKLQGNQALTPEDHNYIRWWIVGEAEGHLHGEDFQGRWDRFQRLGEELGAYESREVSGQELLVLEGILEDAARLATELRRMLEDKERIVRFEGSMRNLDEDGRQFLARMLQGKLESSEI